MCKSIKIISFIIFALLFLLSYSMPYNQKKEEGLNNNLIIIGVIKIDNPILVYYTNIGKYKHRNTILISQENVSSIKEYNSYRKAIGNIGYKYFNSCLFTGYFYRSFQDSLKYIDILDTIRRNCNENKGPILYGKRTKLDKNIYYESILTNRFLLCLIKVSLLNKCEPIENEPIEDFPNGYLKLVVPLKW